MKNKLYRWFSAPVFEGDEEKTWRASLINLSVITCVLIVMLVVFGNLIGGRTPPSVFIIDVIMLVILLMINGLLKAGRVTIAGISLTAMGIILISAATASLGTIRTPTTAFLFLIVIIAGLLFGRIGLLLSTVLGSLSVLGLMLAENAGMLPEPDFSVTITQWVSYTVGFGLIGALTHFSYSTNRQALERTFQSKHRLREAERIAQMGHWEHDLKTNTLYWSDEIYNIFEIPEDEISSTFEEFLNMVHPADREFVDKTYTESIRTRKPYSIDHRIQLPDGRIKYVHEQCESYYDDQGNVIRSIGTVQDITNRKRAEEAYENIINNSLQAFVIFQDEKIVFANPEAEKMTGYTRNELYAFTPEQIFALIPEKDRKEGVETIRDRLTSAALPERMVFCINRKDGEIRWLESYASVVDYHGRPAIQAAYVDITERIKNEEQLRKLLRAVEAAPVSIVITDKNARIEYVNPYFSEITGFESKEVIEANPSVLQSGLTPPEKYKDLWKTVLNGQIWEGEFINEKKNGERYTELALISPVFDASDRITHFVAIKQDITSRKQIEQQLKDSEERFRVLFEDSADAYLILDDNIFVDCNQAAVKMLRASSKQEVLSTHPSDLSPEYQPDGKLSAEKADEMIRLALENGSYRFEWVHRRMDGEDFPVEVLLTPLSITGKTIIHVVWRDITARKKTERDLQVSEERHRKLVEYAGDIVYRISTLGYFEYFNPQAELLTGYNEDELTGMLFTDLVRPDWRNNVQEHYLSQRNQRIAETTLQFPIITREGEEKWIEQIVNLIEEDGEPVGLQGIAREITKRKHSEEREQEQRILAEALRESAEALNQSISLDEVLKIIINNAKKMVACDSASITWVLEDIVRIVEYKGIEEEQEKWFMGQTFKLEDFATFRKVVEDKSPVIIADTTTDPDWTPLQHTEWIRSHLESPVIIDGKVVAIISLDSKEMGFYNEEHARNLQAFANQAAVAIQNAILFDDVQNLATTDELTGLYNRRGFYEVSRREVGRLQRYWRPFSVLFIDIDHFKKFNDEYSYEVGDQVLQWVAETLQTNVREIDVIGRYGGEEIVILLPEIDDAEAEEIAERIRVYIEKSHFPLGQQKLHITVSIGIATLTPAPGQTIPTSSEAQTKAIEDLIAKAGEALHVAKQQGRNQVVTHGH